VKNNFNLICESFIFTRYQAVIFVLVLSASVHSPPPPVDFVIQLPLSNLFFSYTVGNFSVQLLSFDLFFSSAAFTYITFLSEGCGTYSSVAYFDSSESGKNFLKNVT
jgi:hypothetical protein